MPGSLLPGGKHHNKTLSETMTQLSEFNASELCSRKLWQLVSAEDRRAISAAELREAVEELAARRHYLAELRQIGELEGSLPGA